jgi:hypothetical protein
VQPGFDPRAPYPPPHRPVRWDIAAVIALLSLLVTAVGVYIAYAAWIDPHPPGPPPVPEGRTAYIAKADVRCRIAADQMSALGRSPHNDPVAHNKWYSSNVDILHRLVGEWDAIPYPEADGPTVLPIMELLKQVDAHGQSSRKYGQMALRSTVDGPRDKLLNRAEDEWQAARTDAITMEAKAKAYGMKDCSTLLDFN